MGDTIINENQPGEENGPITALHERLKKIYTRTTPPNGNEYLKLVYNINRVLENEDESIRPKDARGKAGGIIHLKKDIPTLIMPDLHARMEFLLSTMLYSDESGVSVLQKLALNQLQVVCVGDGFHAEGRKADRWKKAFDEFQNLYQTRKYMDEEMKESMGVMEMVMELKGAYPANFHFLKGNHENISNENGGGNFPFRKYAYEGAMVLEYVKRFYGEEFLKVYYAFEKNMPLLAIGRHFIISHSEPKTFYEAKKIINYRTNPDVVTGLTWTDNNDAEKDSVTKMIQYYLPEEVWWRSMYFGGHRPVSGTHNKRAQGKYIQLHNPLKFYVTIVDPEGEIDLEKSIIEIENKAGALYS
ncbi:MAG: metallophosphoesterase [Spirochaetales bacterium]|nr:metallophosphoesterase [Spirochaetales bacterium]